MNTKVKKGAICTLVFAFCIMASTTLAAHGGGWHGGGWHGGGWHGGWYGGGWHGGWYGGSLIIGSPYYYNSCPVIRVCRYDRCWLQRSCY